LPPSPFSGNTSLDGFTAEAMSYDAMNTVSWALMFREITLPLNIGLNLIKSVKALRFLTKMWKALYAIDALVSAGFSGYSLGEAFNAIRKGNTGQAVYFLFAAGVLGGVALNDRRTFSNLSSKLNTPVVTNVKNPAKPSFPLIRAADPGIDVATSPSNVSNQDDSETDSQQEPVRENIDANLKANEIIERFNNLNPLPTLKQKEDFQFLINVMIRDQVLITFINDLYRFSLEAKKNAHEWIIEAALCFDVDELEILGVDENIIEEVRELDQKKYEKR
jgi:hypothetical protein